MEVKYDVVRPNLYVVEDRIFFGINSSDVIQVCRNVDEAISKHIGVLKVRESEFKVVGTKRSYECSKDFNISLKEYLDVLEARLDESGILERVTTLTSKLFGLDHVVNAQTTEHPQDLANWLNLQQDLADSNKTFDKYEKFDLVYRVDREKTLGNMKKLYEELNQKMPDNHASLFVSALGQKPIQATNAPCIGVVEFEQLRSIDIKLSDVDPSVKIEETKEDLIERLEKAKADLIERLKKVEGPCLSYDAPAILQQMARLYRDATSLVQQYGDILLNPDWRKRFFRYDP